MRLSSLHSSLLDRQGLVAGWREALLAQTELLDQTRGYTAHPQLERYQSRPEPKTTIGAYIKRRLPGHRSEGLHGLVKKLLPCP